MFIFFLWKKSVGTRYKVCKDVNLSHKADFIISTSVEAINGCTPLLFRYIQWTLVITTLFVTKDLALKSKLLL